MLGYRIPSSCCGKCQGGGTAESVHWDPIGSKSAPSQGGPKFIKKVEDPTGTSEIRDDLAIGRCKAGYPNTVP